MSEPPPPVLRYCDDCARETPHTVMLTTTEYVYHGHTVSVVETAAVCDVCGSVDRDED